MPFYCTEVFSSVGALRGVTQLNTLQQQNSHYCCLSSIGFPQKPSDLKLFAFSVSAVINAVPVSTSPVSELEWEVCIEHFGTGGLHLVFIKFTRFNSCLDRCHEFILHKLCCQQQGWAPQKHVHQDLPVSMRLWGVKLRKRLYPRLVTSPGISNKMTWEALWTYIHRLHCSFFFKLKCQHHDAIPLGQWVTTSVSHSTQLPARLLSINNCSTVFELCTVAFLSVCVMVKEVGRLCLILPDRPSKYLGLIG